MEPSGENDHQTDETVLSPEELDIAADENVEQLDEGRFVIGADGPPDRDGIESRREAMAAEAESEDKPSADRDEVAADRADLGPRTESNSDISPDPRKSRQDQADSADNSTTGDSSKITGSEVKHWLARELSRGDNRYAYRIAAKTGDSIQHQRLASDDIGVAFDSLLLWYARQVGAGTAVEEALGILLAESDIQVRYPTARLLDYLEEHDLGPDDSIADLVNVVHDADGLVFPQSNRNQK